MKVEPSSMHRENVASTINGEKRKRAEEKEEYETGWSTEDVRVVFLLRPLKFLVKEEGEPDDLSDRELVSCEFVRVVPDVSDVVVSPSSVVTEMCEVSPCCSDWDFVEPQSFSFSKKRALCCSDKQEEMRYEGSPVKAPSFSRKRMTPPTPMQYSYASFEGKQGSNEDEGRGWNVRERTIIARTNFWKEVTV